MLPAGHFDEEMKNVAEMTGSTSCQEGDRRRSCRDRWLRREGGGRRGRRGRRGEPLTAVGNADDLQGVHFGSKA